VDPKPQRPMAGMWLLAPVRRHRSRDTRPKNMLTTLFIVAGMFFVGIAVIQAGGLWTRWSVVFWAGLAVICFLAAVAT
jgi:hypothetical protein